MTFIPPHITQADGTESQWFNCWATVGAWLVRGGTRGRRRPTPERFRKLARRPPLTPGGLADVERGLRRAGVWPRARLLVDVPREKLRARFLRDSGKLYGAESDFEVWPDYANCLPGYNEREDAYHFIGVVAGEGDGPNVGRVRVMDPLCRRFRWVDVDDVVHAIVRYNNEHAGETKGTADVIVLVPPPKAIPEEPDELPEEPDDAPEKPPLGPQQLLRALDQLKALVIGDMEE